MANKADYGDDWPEIGFDEAERLWVELRRAAAGGRLIAISSR